MDNKVGSTSNLRWELRYRRDELQRCIKSAETVPPEAFCRARYSVGYDFRSLRTSLINLDTSGLEAGLLEVLIKRLDILEGITNHHVNSENPRDIEYSNALYLHLLKDLVQALDEAGEAL